MWSDYGIEVTLIEPNASFVSCPISNLVIGGSKTMADITMSYENLVKRHGVKLIKDFVTQVDPDKRLVKLSNGSEVAYDRLILSPGVDFMFDALPGLNKPDAQEDAEHMYRYMMQYPESSVPNTKCPRTIQLQHIGDSWTLIQGKMKRYLKRKETMKAAEGRLLKSRKVSIPALEIGTAATPEWYANFSDPRKLQPVNLEAQLIQEALDAQFGL
jgi:hypothetical protein